jgi:hypothetical protein
MAQYIRIGDEILEGSRIVGVVRREKRVIINYVTETTVQHDMFLRLVTKDFSFATEQKAHEAHEIVLRVANGNKLVSLYSLSTFIIYTRAGPIVI